MMIMTSRGAFLPSILSWRTAKSSSLMVLEVPSVTVDFYPITSETIALPPTQKRDGKKNMMANSQKITKQKEPIGCSRLAKFFYKHKVLFLATTCHNILNVAACHIQNVLLTPHPMGEGQSSPTAWTPLRTVSWRMPQSHSWYQIWRIGRAAYTAILKVRVRCTA